MSRFLVTWRHRRLRRTYPVGFLTATDSDFCFSYLLQAATTPGFQPFVNFPDLGRDYRSSRLFPFFSQRVMSRSRPDYLPYLHALGLADDATPIEVLGRSNGQRRGDTVQVILEPKIADDGGVDHIFLVSGVRHATGDESDGRLGQLNAGDLLSLRADPENPANSDALLVCTTRGDQLGWVPDGLLPLAHQVLNQEHQMTIVRVNSVEWPSHLRVLVRLAGKVPPRFRPFGAVEALTAA